MLKSSVRCAKAMFIDVFVLLAYLWVDNVQDGLINPGLINILCNPYTNLHNSIYNVRDGPYSVGLMWLAPCQPNLMSDLI